jgi:tetratricopeptide (TPR) repeat protein
MRDRTFLFICLIYLISGFNNISAQDTEAILLKAKSFSTDAQKIGYLTEQIKIYPNCKELYSCRAMHKEWLDDFRGARKDYDHLIQLDSKDAKSYSLRANFKYQYLNDFEGAISDINQAIQINSDEQKYFHSRAIFKWQSGKYKAAINDFDIAIKLAENKVGNFTLGRIICGRGECKMKINDKNGACLDWSKAGELGYDCYDLIKKYCNQ